MQDTQFDSHLKGLKKESLYWLTKTIAVITKAFRESEIKPAMLKNFIPSKLTALLVLARQCKAGALWKLGTVSSVHLSFVGLCKTCCKWQRSLSR